MDVIEFFKQHDDMCKQHGNCTGCPINDNCMNFDEMADAVSKGEEDKVNAIITCVDQWSKRPKFTNADKFRKVFGLALMPSHDHNGYLYFYKDAGSRSINTALSSEEAVTQWLNTEYVEPDI